MQTPAEITVTSGGNDTPPQEEITTKMKLNDKLLREIVCRAEVKTIVKTLPADLSAN